MIEVLLLVFAAGVLGVQAAPQPNGGVAKPTEYGFRIVHVYPHDPTAFTQGLEFRDGYLYEGTGLAGHSTVRKERLETGEILREIHLAPEYFGEGITVMTNRLFELTWQAHIGFIYDQKTFRKQSSFSYTGEGWGSRTTGGLSI